MVSQETEKKQEETKLDVRANLYNYSDGSGDEEEVYQNKRSNVMNYNDLEELD